jgi:hypothetical protein
VTEGGPSAFAQGYGGPPKPWRRWSGPPAAAEPEGSALRSGISKKPYGIASAIAIARSRVGLSTA